MKCFPLACLVLFAACAGSALPDDPAVDASIALVNQASSIPVDSPAFCVVGYFPEWAVYAKHYTVDRIPADSLTHVNYAFAKVLANGSVEAWDSYAAFAMPAALEHWPAGNIPQLRELKRRHPHLRVLVSIGGWTGSSHFSSIAADTGTRRHFARSVAAFAGAHGFDGVDLDWEFPVIAGLSPGRPEDRGNFTLLARALRAAIGDSLLLTAAVNATPDGIDAIDYRTAAPLFDWFHVMAYDFAGPWNPAAGRVGHHAPIRGSDGRSLTGAVLRLIDAGLPPDKIVPGLPLYGRSFSGVDSPGEVGSSFAGAGPGSIEPGVIDYTDLSAAYIDSTFYQSRWDSATEASSLYSARHRVFISFESVSSAERKIAWIRTRGLRGIMFWELSQDFGGIISCARPLLRRQQSP